MIKVVKVDDKMYEVTVSGRTITTHKVTVTPEYYELLTGGQVPVEVLIEKSFEFLLERESNTSILRRFELPVIGQYFPEYERVIVEMIK
jgi:hypothetical protein